MFRGSRSLFALFFLFLFVGCDLPPPCSPETCSGCCMGGVCQTGNTKSGCGRGGDECKQCGTGFICASDQQCTAQSSCDTSSCPGCCFNGTCVITPTTNACGLNGDLCKQCGQNTVCDTSTGQCVRNPLSKWTVSAVRAEVTPLDTNGSGWDIGDDSAPDVYVSLICPPSSAPNAISTPSVESYAPEWTTLGCTATMEDLSKETVQIVVYDYDPLTPSNDLVASFTMQLKDEIISDQREFTIAPTQALSSMTFRITLAEN